MLTRKQINLRKVTIYRIAKLLLGACFFLKKKAKDYTLYMCCDNMDLKNIIRDQKYLMITLKLIMIIGSETNK